MIFVAQIDPPVPLNLNLNIECEWVNICKGYHYMSMHQSGTDKAEFEWCCGQDISKPIYILNDRFIAPMIANIMGLT